MSCFTLLHCGFWTDMISLDPLINLKYLKAGNKPKPSAVAMCDDPVPMEANKDNYC